MFYIIITHRTLCIAWEKHTRSVARKIFAEPRLVIFVSIAHPEATQEFLVSEKSILFQITNKKFSSFYTRNIFI